MKLIDASTFELQEFTEIELPEYAVLSHRWTNEEVTFNEMRDPKFVTNRGSHLLGATKIRAMCAKALKAKIQYVWVDTCCIDKSSSAEVSEAVNSMFTWYQEADVCFVHLSDVTLNKDDWEGTVREFVNSEWWTRAWTLPELLAPNDLAFFDMNWHIIGTKETLGREIEAASGISDKDFEYFRDRQFGTEMRGVPLASLPSIAKRMSWAANRRCTRSEDIAYSLLGIFNVSMPIIYGEGGPKAFYRLQQEIMRQSDDETLFAWSGRPLNRDKETVREYGLLAYSPAQFADSGNYIRHEWEWREPYELTNKGIRMNVELFKSQPGEHDETNVVSSSTYTVKLNCMERGDSRPLGLYLEFIPFGNESKFYNRLGPLTKVDSDSEKEREHEIFIVPFYKSPNKRVKEAPKEEDHD